jgi:hypothetical protein
MARKQLPFDKWVEETGLAAKWEARGRADGEARGEARGEQNAWKKAIELMKQGHTVEELERMNPSVPGSK